MTSPVIDVTKNWFFHFGGLVKNKIPLDLEEKEGVVTFVIYLEPNRSIQFELNVLNEKKNIIEGNYTLSNFENKERVNFQILKPGKLLAHPTGSLSRDVWMITSSDS
jgi:hypothetical protein